MAQNVDVGKAGARIGFICTAPAHLDRNGALVDHLTIHATDWAYCPSNVRIDGHDWKATGGLSMADLEILVRGMRERAGANGDSRRNDR
ncbi:MAG: hypothetical protein M3O99_08775 [Chloroflexota bacterium]|nr:hypothetical protein [Chloroflexota bacterium]